MFAAKAPILVTGVPRAGTTWLARMLATARGTGLAGREPMNPRGRQFALGGTLSSWTRAEEFNRYQRLLLQASYRGLNPLTCSRYGHHQLNAVLPSTRVVVKDPFALLSIPAVIRATGAQAVLVYRHPAASLLSYRRMGWAPDVEELLPLVARFNAQPGILRPIRALPSDPDEATAMGWFWTSLHTMALADIDGMDSVTIVSHEEISSGIEARERLFAHLGLSQREDEHVHTVASSRLARSGTGSQNRPALHTFDRDSAAVAATWRDQASDDELAIISGLAAPVLERLERQRLRLS